MTQKCHVLWITNKYATLYTRAQYNVSCGKVSYGIGKTLGFFIPEGCQPINVRLKFGGTRPLFVVDGKQSTALMFTNSTQIKKYITKTIYVERDGKRIEQIVKIPEYEIQGNTIQLFPFSDETVAFKLNLLAKREFYEMLAKQMKLSLTTMLIYFGAGYGLFRFAEYAVRIIFLQEG